MITSAQVVEMSVTVTDNKPFQDYPHPDDPTTRSIDITLFDSLQDLKGRSFTNHANEISLRDQLGLPDEDSKQLLSSAVEQTNEADIVKSHGESTALNQSTNDLQGRQESNDLSLPNDMHHSDSKHDPERTDTNISTDCCNKIQTCSGGSELPTEETATEETIANVVTDQGLGPFASTEKKTDFSKSKTDASQIIADVVEGIEQESAPPVAPPRRRKKKKKASEAEQVSAQKGRFWWPWQGCQK